MDSLVEIIVLVLSFCAQPIVGMDAEQHCLSGNEKNQNAKTKNTGELPFWGIAGCAVYRFCKYHNKTQAKCTQSTIAQSDIVNRLNNPSTKLKACAVPLAIIVPPSPVSSIKLCSSRPTPRILADGKFTFW